MIKNILLALLISSQALAGLPPTTLKGQSGSNVTTFGFQVPQNQATQISGVNSLIETGNGNLLPNPGFEGTTGWTASGGATTAINTTAVGTGLNGYDWNSNSASQTLRGTAITIPPAWKGQLGIAECFIKTPSGTATHTIGVYDGSSLLSSTTVSSNTIFVASQHFFTFPTSGTITTQLTSVASDEPEIYVDDCYIGLLSRHPAGSTSAAITAPVAYTPTFAGLGTVSAVNITYRQIGNFLEISGTFQAGTTTGSIASMSLPSGLTLDTTNLIANTTSAAGTGLGQYTANGVANADGRIVSAPSTSTSLLYFGASTTTSALFPNAGSTISANNAIISVYAMVPVSGLASVVNTATTPVISAPTSYTPTFTGWGTVTTSNFKYWQIGSSVYVEGRFQVATSTATEARVSFPSVCSSASSDYVTLQKVGWGATSVTGRSVAILAEPSAAYFTFGDSSSSGAGLAKANGSSLASSGENISFTAMVRCTGMPGVIPAPNLIGFTTNNGSSAIRIEGATLAAPSGGSCAVTEVGGSDWLNGNCTSGATGVCTCSVNSGIFSSAPICQISVTNLAAANSRDEQITSTSTSSIVTFTATTGGTAVNNDVTIMCMGPR